MPKTTRTMPMKIAVPTAATAGTRIETQPRTMARTPTVISSFQLRRRPSRISGSICTPLISMKSDPKSRRGRDQPLRSAPGPGWCNRLARQVLVLEAGVRALPPELLVGHPRYLTGFCARLHRRPPRRGDTEHAHRFQPKAELLAALGGGNVMAAELAHPLEP